MSLDSLPTLIETVKIHSLRANKTLGQHFLLDMNVTDKIARLAAPLDSVSVAEIGPGPGGLTRALLANGAEAVSYYTSPSPRDQRGSRMPSSA